MMTNKSDKELLQAIRLGDEKAFQCIFDRHWNTLFSFVYKLISDEDQTKDILQNTFLEIWKRKDTLIVEDSIMPYLFKIAKNDVISLFRKDKVRLQGDEILVRNLQSADLPDERMLASELQQTIDTELVKMPFNMRQCFHLSRYENKSVRDIAEELRLSEQTVKNNISEALRRLRQALTHNSSGYLALLIPVLINLT
jgi:RNA polymerase sigma-70 factor (family 1)